MRWCYELEQHLLSALICNPYVIAWTAQFLTEKNFTLDHVEIWTLLKDLSDKGIEHSMPTLIYQFSAKPETQKYIIKLAGMWTGDIYVTSIWQLLEANIRLGLYRIVAKNNFDILKGQDLQDIIEYIINISNDVLVCADDLVSTFNQNTDFKEVAVQISEMMERVGNKIAFVKSLSSLIYRLKEVEQFINHPEIRSNVGMGQIESYIKLYMPTIFKTCQNYNS